jgi:hypothetical protein
VFALPELCDLLIFADRHRADTSIGNIYRPIARMKDCFRHWWLIRAVRISVARLDLGISASVVDWLPMATRS